MPQGAGIQLFVARFEKKMGADNDKVGFDPFSILTILLPMILSCIKPKPAQLRRRLGNRVRIAALVCANTGCPWTEGTAVADQLLDMAAEAKDSELQQFIADCCATEN